MTAGVVARGTRTPRGRLVFVPVDGRAIQVPEPSLFDQLSPAVPAELRHMFVQDDTPRGAPILVPCLIALRGEFNRLSPNRDKASDGWVGDTKHAASSSDHNGDESGVTPYEDSDSVDEVHAIDVDRTGPWPPGVTFRGLIDAVVESHRKGSDDRLQYVIFERKIISRSWAWDSWHPYTGVNPHDQHAHFSARYTTAQESDTSTWGVAIRLEDTMAEGLELDKAPVKYPKIDPENTHYTGWNTLGATRDLAHETRDKVNALAAKVDLMQRAVLAAVQGVDEEAVLAAVNTRAAELREEIEATRLGNPGQPVEEIAAALRGLLGDRAAEVGAALQAAADSDAA